jgi:hypothetical protein
MKLEKPFSGASKSWEKIKRMYADQAYPYLGLLYRTGVDYLFNLRAHSNLDSALKYLVPVLE